MNTLLYQSLTSHERDAINHWIEFNPSNARIDPSNARIDITNHTVLAKLREGHAKNIKNDPAIRKVIVGGYDKFLVATGKEGLGV